MLAASASRRLTSLVPLLLAHAAVAAADQGLPYQLRDEYVGPDFFSSWDFFTQPDPSNGHVDYVDSATASAESMARSSEDSAYIGVDLNSRTSSIVKRRSVRIQSKATYNGGLFIVNVEHMPTGCGVWPAFWMFGEDPNHEWPEWGEYDIIETLHRSTSVMTALHTLSGCDQGGLTAGLDFAQTWAPGRTGQVASDCFVRASSQYPNQGCSQQGPGASAGQPFNGRGGGTFAGEWDPENGHIRTWFWPAESVPPDVQVRRPDPSSWGTPDSYFSLAPQTCHSSHFQNMRMVFDVNLCGDLGNAYFADACPLEAKTMTCEEYVSEPGRVSEAFWFLRGLDVYQRGSPPSMVFLFDDHNTAGSRSVAKNAIVAASVLVLAIGAIGVGLQLVKGQFQLTQRGFALRADPDQSTLPRAARTASGSSPYALAPNLLLGVDGKRRTGSSSADTAIMSEWSRAHSRSSGDWSVGGSP